MMIITATHDPDNFIIQNIVKLLNLSKYFMKIQNLLSNSSISKKSLPALTVDLVFRRVNFYYII